MLAQRRTLESASLISTQFRCTLAVVY